MGPDGRAGDRDDGHPARLSEAAPHHRAAKAPAAAEARALLLWQVDDLMGWLCRAKLWWAVHYDLGEIG